MEQQAYVARSPAHRRGSGGGGKHGSPQPAAAGGPAGGVLVPIPRQRQHSHDVQHLPAWTAGLELDVASIADSALRGLELGDLLALKAQQCSVFHDECARQVAVHCPPVAALLVRLWSSLSSIADKCLTLYERTAGARFAHARAREQQQ